ncbi:cellulose binding domain-containing protein [Actinoplanes sp. DH11]|uniref:rhamnogalacturonan lyase family protein n=1 Tax=Actinoplanes sp. DH11 TaxID=2857011 RepID=UPI001E466B15|nr:cellulose binding domain-containing protein [Actinoplanes sp. DH11]
MPAADESATAPADSPASGSAATSVPDAAGSVAVALDANAAAGCRVDYAVTNQWQGGFGAAVSVTNLGDPITGWTLTFSFAAGQSVTQLWNGSVTQSGSTVSVRDASWNAAVPTNGSVSFGFNATATGANPAPGAFALNGTACTGGVTGPSSPAPSSPAPSSPAPSSPAPSSPAPSSPAPSSPPPVGSGRQMERLDRGLISVRSGSGNLVSWRWLAADPADVAFNVYRDGTRVNPSPITGSTNYLDAGAAAGAAYTVRAVTGGTEQPASPAALRFGNGYLDVPVQNPDPARYAANDASVADLDGDGQLDIMLKWEPLNAKDNSQAGVTDPVHIDAYRTNGTRLWRINLGRNIRAGAHYTQFQAYDYDGDGSAEVAMKTADGTVSGTGQVIGSATADHRNADGYVLAGPEFLTVFNGRTGAALATANYDPPRGTVSSWGDNYGNRVDRFLAATAYLDGARPSIVMARGYYTRTVIAAWDFRNGALTRRWTFDSNAAGNSTYAGQGNHNLSIADVDADGRDEIVYGAMAVDDNGTGLWNNRNGHGDAMHVGDLDPTRTGLEVFKVDEDASKPSSWFADARTGQVLWSTPASGDNGRGVSADVWAGSPGAESWSSAPAGLRSPNGTVVNSRKPGSTNFLAWWDADPVRELLDGTHIDKYGTTGDTRLLTASGVHANNGTKSTPALSGDILGDWREEVIWPTSDNTALRIYATPTPTDRRITTLLQDAQYRLALAWQNTAYNQPPHPSFFIGDGMRTPPRPTIRQP